MALKREGRKETSVNANHKHMYAERVANPNRASYTTKTDGHRHRIIRDAAGKALRLEREVGANGRTHTHSLTV